MVMVPAGTHLFIPSFTDSTIQKIDLSTQSIVQTYPLTLPANSSNASRYNITALSESKLWLIDGQNSRAIHAIDLVANTSIELPVATKNWSIASYIPQINRVLATAPNIWNSLTHYPVTMSVDPAFFTSHKTNNNYASGIPVIHPHSPTIDGRTIVQGNRLLDSQTLLEKRKFDEILLTQSAYGKIVVGKNKIFSTSTGVPIATLPEPADLAAMGHNQEKVFTWSNDSKKLHITDITSLYPLEPVRFRSHIADQQNILTNTPGLSWNASPYTTKYRVYLGSDPDDVRDATPTSPEMLAETSTTSVTFTSPLSPNSTYYWRVDRLNEHGAQIGTVLSFSTTSLQLSGTTINLAGFSGHSLAPTSIDVSGISGTGWQVTTDTPWLTADVENIGTPGSFTLVADTTGLATGVHQGSITLIEGSKAIPVTVHLHVLKQNWKQFLTDYRQNCIWALQPETLDGRAALAKINPVDGSLISASLLDPGHFAMTLSPDQRSLFLINSLSKTAQRIDPVTLKVTDVKTLPQEDETTTTPVLVAGPNNTLYYSVTGTTLQAFNWNTGLTPDSYQPLTASKINKILYSPENQQLSTILLKNTTSNYGPIYQDTLQINADASLSEVTSRFIYNGNLNALASFSQSANGSRSSYNQYWAIQSPEQSLHGTATEALDTSWDGSLTSGNYSITPFGENTTLQSIGSATHLRFTPGQQSVIAWQASTQTFIVTAIDSAHLPSTSALRPLNPINNAGLLPEQGTLTWQRPPFAERFRVYLATSSSALASSHPLSEQTQSSYTLSAGQLTPNQNYHWRIDWFDGASWTQGPVWQFNTMNITLGSKSLSIQGVLRHTLDSTLFPVQNPTATTWTVSSNTSWLTATKEGDSIALTSSYSGITPGTHLAHITLSQGGHHAVIPVLYHAIEPNFTSVIKDDSFNCLWALHYGSPGYLCKVDPDSARITHMIELPNKTTAVTLSPAQHRLYGISFANDTVFTINRATYSLGTTIPLPESKDGESSGGYFLAAGPNETLFYNSHPGTNNSRLAAVDFTTGNVPASYTQPDAINPGAITYNKNFNRVLIYPGLAWTVGSTSYPSTGQLITYTLNNQGGITDENTVSLGSGYLRGQSLSASWDGSVVGTFKGWLTGFPESSTHHTTSIAEDLSGDGSTVIAKNYFCDAVTGENLAPTSIGYSSSFLRISPSQENLIWWDTSNRIFKAEAIPASILLKSPGLTPRSPLINGAVLVGAESIQWQGVPTASAYRVYLGSDAADLAASSHIVEQVGTRFTIPTNLLTLDQSYLWRVDWFDGSTWQTGTTWSFTYLNSPLSSARLAFDALKKNEHNAHSIHVSGVASAVWSVTSHSSWISVSKSSATTFLISPSAVNLSEGLHQGAITLTISGKSMIIPVDLNVISVTWKQLLADSTHNCIWALSSSPAGYLAKVSPDDSKVSTFTKLPVHLDTLELSPLRDHLYGISSAHEAFVEIDRNTLSIATQHSIPAHGFVDPEDGSTKRYHLAVASDGILYYNINPWTRYSSMAAYHFPAGSALSGFSPPSIEIGDIHYIHAKGLIVAGAANGILATPILPGGLLDLGAHFLRTRTFNVYAHNSTHPMKSSWDGDTLITPYGIITNGLQNGPYFAASNTTDLSGSGAVSITARYLYHNSPRTSYGYLQYNTSHHTFTPDQQKIIYWNASLHVFSTITIETSYPNAVQPIPGIQPLHPAIGSTVTPSHSTLRWQFPETATKFKLYFDKITTPLDSSNLIGEFLSTTHTLPAFESNINYHWRVDWYDGNSWHTGATWNFDTPKIFPDTQVVNLVTFGASYTSTATINVSGVAGASWTVTGADSWMVVNITNPSTPGSFTISSNASNVSSYSPLNGTVTLSDGVHSLDIAVKLTGFTPSWERLIADHRQNCLWAVDERYIAKISQTDGSILNVVFLENDGASISLDSNHRWLYALDQQGVIYKINPLTASITRTLTLPDVGPNNFKRHLAIGPNDKAYTYTNTNPSSLLVVDLATGANAQDPVPLNLSNISRLHYDKASNSLYFANNIQANSSYAYSTDFHAINLDSVPLNETVSTWDINTSYWQFYHYPTSSWDGLYISSSTALHHIDQQISTTETWSSGIRDIAYDGSLILSDHLYERASATQVLTLPNITNVAAITPDQQSVITWNASAKQFVITAIPVANRPATPGIQLLNPADSSVVGFSNPLLRWLGNPMAESFKLFFGTESSSLSEIIETIKNSHLLSSLDRATQYFWKVSWFDGSVWSDTDVNDFTTDGFLVGTNQVIIESIVGNIPDATTFELEKDAALTVTASTDVNWLDVTINGNTVSLSMNGNTPQTWGEHSATLTLHGGSDDVQVPVILVLEKLTVKRLLKDVDNNRLLAHVETQVSKRQRLLVLDGERIARFIPLPEGTSTLRFTPDCAAIYGTTTSPEGIFKITQADLTVHEWKATTGTKFSTFDVDNSGNFYLSRRVNNTSTLTVLNFTTLASETIFTVSGNSSYIGIPMVSHNNSQLAILSKPEEHVVSFDLHTLPYLPANSPQTHQLNGNINFSNYELMSTQTGKFWSMAGWEIDLNAQVPAITYAGRIVLDLSANGEHYLLYNGLYDRAFNQLITQASGYLAAFFPDYNSFLYWNANTQTLTSTPITDPAIQRAEEFYKTPADGDNVPSDFTQLLWNAPYGVQNYRIFMGNSASAVASATLTSSEFLVETTDTRHSIATPSPGIYHWRVDRLSQSGWQTGVVTAFTVTPLSIVGLTDNQLNTFTDRKREWVFEVAHPAGQQATCTPSESWVNATASPGSDNSHTKITLLIGGADVPATITPVTLDFSTTGSQIPLHIHTSTTFGSFNASSLLDAGSTILGKHSQFIFEYRKLDGVITSMVKVPWNRAVSHDIDTMDACSFSNKEVWYYNAATRQSHPLVFENYVRNAKVLSQDLLLVGEAGQIHIVQPSTGNIIASIPADESAWDFNKATQTLLCKSADNEVLKKYTVSPSSFTFVTSLPIDEAYSYGGIYRVTGTNRFVCGRHLLADDLSIILTSAYSVNSSLGLMGGGLLYLNNNSIFDRLTLTTQNIGSYLDRRLPTRDGHSIIKLTDTGVEMEHWTETHSTNTRTDSFGYLLPGVTKTSTFQVANLTNAPLTVNAPTRPGASASLSPDQAVSIPAYGVQTYTMAVQPADFDATQASTILTSPTDTTLNTSHTVLFKTMPNGTTGQETTLTFENVTYPQQGMLLTGGSRRTHGQTNINTAQNGTSYIFGYYTYIPVISAKHDLPFDLLSIDLATNNKNPALTSVILVGTKPDGSTVTTLLAVDATLAQENDFSTYTTELSDFRGIVSLTTGESTNTAAIDNVKVKINENGVQDLYDYAIYHKTVLAPLGENHLPLQDYDGDGVANILEWLHGTDPLTQNASHGRLQVILDDNGEPMISFQRRKNLLPNTLILEWSSDLITWDPVLEGVDHTLIEINSMNADREQITLKLSSPIQKLFYRTRLQTHE